MGDIYASDNGRPRGKCSVCGTTEEHTYKGKSTNRTYPKPFYFSVFEKVNWFRGDDEYKGKICKDCLKAGRIAETHKQVPAAPPKGIYKPISSSEIRDDGGEYYNNMWKD